MRALPVAAATKHHSAPQPITLHLNHYAMGPMDVSCLFPCILCFFCPIPVTQTPPLSDSIRIICILPLSLLVDKRPLPLPLPRMKYHQCIPYPETIL